MKINTHGLKIKGLKKAAGYIQSIAVPRDSLPNLYVQVNYDTLTGSILTNLEASISNHMVYEDVNIIYVNHYGWSVTMQQLADDINAAVYFHL